MIFRTSLQSQSFLYDFNKVGGAIGSYAMGISIPYGATVFGLSQRTFTTFTGAGGAQFSIGTANSTVLYTSGNSPLLLNKLAVAPGSNDLINSAGYIPAGGFADGLQVLFTISGGIITAGASVFNLLYFFYS